MSTITIRKAFAQDEEAIWDIFHRVIQSADTYAFYPDTQKQYALKYWTQQGTTAYVAAIDRKVVGTFCIRENRPGLGSHVANASYMVHPDFHGQGVGRKMGEESLKIAADNGYKAMQFNFVVSTNEPAVKLWKSLGFKIIGTTPEGFYHKDKGYVDSYIMWKKLEG
ncbi:MAG TPA: GNAT family N-acetyltransferase [Alphaproteobacteria bacterium]|nr:GNAT family N-acetyltransferase [Alphaproteobacteria bacterium]